MDSYYYDPCPDTECRVQWKANDDAFAIFDVEQLEEFEPREPISLSFDWDSCQMSPPEIDCSMFPDVAIGYAKTRVNQNNPDEIIDELDEGACWGSTGWSY